MRGKSLPNQKHPFSGMEPFPLTPTLSPRGEGVKIEPRHDCGAVAVIRSIAQVCHAEPPINSDAGFLLKSEHCHGSSLLSILSYRSGLLRIGVGSGAAADGGHAPRDVAARHHAMGRGQTRDVVGQAEHPLAAEGTA